MANKKHFVIIGGGFAGASLASTLEKKLPKDWDIYLLSNTNFLTYNPLLAEVAGASVIPSHVQSPLRQILKRTRIRMVKVDHIDFSNRIVHYHNNEPGELFFDQIVFASGVDANVSLIDGMKENALPLKTVGDALTIRNRMIERLEQATIHPDEKVRDGLTTFIVVGGGFSGVEIAGEMEDFLVSAQRLYKNVKREACRVVLLHATDQLLPELSSDLGKKVEKMFSTRSIDVRLNTQVNKIESDGVVLAGGSKILGSMIVSTVGTQTHAVNSELGLPLERGKIVTQPDMSVLGVDGVWALGDCALVPNMSDGQFCPPTAQFADRQAAALARNVIAVLSGKATKAFSYKPVGMLASIGHHKAVAEIYGIKISGFLAFLLWRGIYLMKVPTFSRKARLLTEWTWDLFFPADTAHLGFKRTGEL